MNDVYVWHHTYPDYAARFVAMECSALHWMRSIDCGLSLTPR